MRLKPFACGSICATAWSRKPAHEFRNKVEELAFQNGLLVMGCGKSTIRIAPALSIDKALIDEGLEKLESAITEVEK